ncbi:MAG: RhuM family protein [Bacteroidota bacterium]
MLKDEIIIYQSENHVNVQVKHSDDSLWLTLNQISELFERDKSVISRHIKKIYSSGELHQEATVAKYATVQKEGDREITREIDYYNLDTIISVGYRVNSKKGTQFRIWANKVLKDHLLNGYSENKHRLKQLKQTIKLIDRATKRLPNYENHSNDFIDLLSEYSRALDLLDEYDHRKLSKKTSETELSFKISYLEAKAAIEELRNKFGASRLFGNEKDNSFQSSISTIDQTFDGHDLYKSIEEKAANLLYLVVKNHSFTDGNKRIAAWLFVWYLDKNKILFNQKGAKKISNNTLVALTLMIAESNPKEKDMLINLITQLIHSENE